MTDHNAQNSYDSLIKRCTQPLPRSSVSVLTTATVLAASLFTASTAMANSEQGTAAAPDNSANAALPIMATTVGEHNTISEGYAKPLDTWVEQVESLRRQPAKRHHYEDAEIWVADVGTLLFNDTDDDGYFAGFSISLDVDVEWETADVFAKFYLQPEGAEPSWLHSTNVFTIYERAVTDQYRVEVDLLDNYPAGDYNLIIDIVNASTGRIADSVSYLTHRNLENLPLESAEYQPATPIYSQPQPTPDHEHGNEHDDHDYDIDHADHDDDHEHGIELEYGLSAHVVEYGGATSSVMLFCLALLGGLRIRQRRRVH